MRQRTSDAVTDCSSIAHVPFFFFSMCATTESLLLCVAGTLRTTIISRYFFKNIDQLSLELVFLVCYEYVKFLLPTPQLDSCKKLEFILTPQKLCVEKKGK